MTAGSRKGAAVHGEAVDIINPLPQRYLTTEPGLGGAIKQRPEDFLVEELPLYEPSGEGEHLYLRVEKTGVSHHEMASCVRRHFDVQQRAVGFAGMKDKAAVTRQTISVHLPRDRAVPAGDVPHERITVLWMRRHTNKMRVGHLAGNRFSIRIRQVDPAKVTVVRRQLARLAATGVPNYFGRQRFGYRVNNHLLGLALLRADWAGLIGELLGSAGSAFPEYQRPRRELFDQGRYREAAVLWTPADRNELTVAKALAGGRRTRDAARAVGKTAMLFWISALQSAVFNRVLDRRLEAGALTRLVEGDLAWKHDNGAVFAVTAGELSRDELTPRLDRLEISPSGPLWGAGMIRPGPAVDAVELEALKAIGVTPETFGTRGDEFRGARRPLRVPVGNPSTEAGVDEDGAYIRVAFDLPAGSYATVLLREMMKAPEAETEAQPRDQTATP
ncbi:MAG: tRNA pseudouridine(13) synthase TruD [Planctomycetota bacterium]